MIRNILRIIFFLALQALLLASLFSCGPSDPDVFSGGSKLSDDALKALEDKICETTAEKYPEVTAPDGSAICFWTDGGSVYHRSLNCYRLKNSSKINSGAVDEALASGKDRNCATCYKNSGENK